MAGYANPFAAVAAFAKLSAMQAIHLFQPGLREHDGSNIDQLAGVLRSMLGQNGQAPLPATFGDVFCTGSLYRSFNNAAVANPGGGQGNATPIAAGMTRFGTVATAGDSAALPAAALGLHPTIINAGAAAMNLFPAVGEAINALAANASFSIPPGRMAVTACTAPGVWSVGLLATA